MPNTPAQIWRGDHRLDRLPAVGEGAERNRRTSWGALGEEVMWMTRIISIWRPPFPEPDRPMCSFSWKPWLMPECTWGFRGGSRNNWWCRAKRSVDYYQAINEKSSVHVAALKNQVTSPGGTTAKRCITWKKAGSAPLSRAVWAAYQRSLELGRRSRCISRDR